MNASPIPRVLSASRVLIAVGAACALLLTYVVAVLTPIGQRLDTSAMVLVADAVTDHGWAELLLHLVSTVTMVGLTAALTGLVACTQGLRPATAAAFTTFGTVVAAEVLKSVLVRPALLSDTAMNSLPSGHVAAVAGLAVAIILAVPPTLRSAATAIGLSAVGVTGLATIALQWHRPSDVFAAALLAVTVGTLVDAATKTTQPSGRTATRAPMPSLTAAGV